MAITNNTASSINDEQVTKNQAYHNLILSADYFSDNAFHNTPAMNKVLACLASIEAIATALDRDVLAIERLDAHKPFSSRVTHGMLAAIEELAFSAAITAELFGESLAIIHRQLAAGGQK